jgi:hypothetical protein
MVPVAVSGLSSGLQALEFGNDHSCVLTESSGVKCWGLNESGQIGDGTTVNGQSPVDVLDSTPP